MRTQTITLCNLLTTDEPDTIADGFYNQNDAISVPLNMLLVSTGGKCNNDACPNPAQRDTFLPIIRTGEIIIGIYHLKG